ncbi:hypothetical protein [Streptacidiphilus pinicola]|uniref:hypothetical protein n=1 Tax=Streptacidiphilus pinicola TaxID=2219663 RepID=UPI0014036BA4|nr:hypothetical protein [Streptacidiphilus pinicola]
MLARGTEYGTSDQGWANRIAAWQACNQGEFAQYSVSGARGQLNSPGWLQARLTAGHGEQAVRMMARQFALG